MKATDIKAGDRIRWSVEEEQDVITTTELTAAGVAVVNITGEEFVRVTTPKGWVSFISVDTEVERLVSLVEQAIAEIWNDFDFDDFWENSYKDLAPLFLAALKLKGFKVVPE